MDFVLDLCNGQIKIKRIYEEETIQMEKAAEKGGYLSWAWNLLPSLNFSYGRDNEDEADEPGHIFDMGVYLESFKLTYKNSEYVQDAIVGGIKRIKYYPILQMSLLGLFFEEQKLDEKDWMCLKAGVTKFCVEPLGIYKHEAACINIIEENVVNIKLHFQYVLFSYLKWYF